MENFTPLASLFGGLLIGLSATLLMLLHGRIAGISGIVGGAIAPSTTAPDRWWRIAFLLGLSAGGLALLPIMPERFIAGIDRSFGALALAGLLVGVGSKMAGGCTSGHGICGLSRLSPRSMIAVATFTLSGAGVVFLVNTLGGTA